MLLSAALLSVSLYGCGPTVLTEAAQKKLESAELAFCQKLYPEDSTTQLVVLYDGGTTTYLNTTTCRTGDYPEISIRGYTSDGGYFSFSGFGYVLRDRLMR
jgi:hypothetical protein